MDVPPQLDRPVFWNVGLTRMIAVAAFLGWNAATAQAGFITTFFDSSQIATDVAAGVTSDTISSNGYLFTYTRDKLFTGGVGLTTPIGRMVRVPWPQGIEAQAVTTQPAGTTNPNYKARITIQRVDGDVFDLTSFTAKLLANTGGAGASIEIMPQLNGEDGFNDPLAFSATGYYGSTFSYSSPGSYLGSTAPLKGFDKYQVSLYVDFALIGLTLDGAPLPDAGNPGGNSGVMAGTATTPEPAALTFAGLAGIGLLLNQRRRS